MTVLPGPEVIACPTPAGNCCGACQRDLDLQEQTEAARLADLVEHGMPSDIYP